MRQFGGRHIAGRIGHANLHEPALRHLGDQIERFARHVEGPGVSHGTDPLVRHHHQAKQALEGVDELHGLLLPGLSLRANRQAEHQIVLSEQVADVVKPGAVELEEVLERMLVGCRRDGRHRPLALGGRGQFQPFGKRRHLLLERCLIGIELHGQVEDAALQTRAHHQPSGVGHTERVSLLLEIEDIDVHGVKAEGQRQFDELAGTSGEGQADRAEVAKHAVYDSPLGAPGWNVVDGEV